jgi:hypothetical protein
MVFMVRGPFVGLEGVQLGRRRRTCRLASDPGVKGELLA